MRECKLCPLSALCFPLGRKKFFDTLQRCPICGAVYLGERRVGAACFAYTGKEIAVLRTACPACRKRKEIHDEKMH